MKKTLLITVFFLGLLYWANNHYFKPSMEPIPFSTGINLHDFSDASKLEIWNHANDEQFLLTKVDNRWIVQKKNVNFVIPPEKVSKLLQTLGQLESDSIVSARQADWQRYGVDTETAIEVSISKNGALLDAFMLGFPEAQKYLRIPKSNEVFLLKSFDLESADFSFLSFRNTRLLDFNPAETDKVAYFGLDTIIAERDSMGWDSTALGNIDRLLLKLSRATSRYFVDNFDETKEDFVIQKLLLSTSGNQEVTLFAYKDTLGQFPLTLHSSTNPEQWFNGDSIPEVRRFFKKIQRGNNKNKTTQIE